jgi:flagellin-specific chaperone FliS
MYQTAYQRNEYRTQDVMGASPIRLVIMAYNLAITACDQKDFTRATKAITVLRDALNFDYPEVSVGLFRLYQWCLDCIRQGDYASAIHTMTELRDAWIQGEKNLQHLAAPTLQSQRISAA